MSFFKTSFLSLIATLVKMLSVLVVNKAVAIFIGPTGLAVIGQFQSFCLIAQTLAQAAINNGVTKYTAEYGSDGKDIPQLFSTALKISVATSLVVSAFVIIFSERLSLIVLKSSSYQYVIILLGISLVFFVLNNLIISILNGLKEISLWVKINIYQSIMILCVTTILVRFYGLHGALISIFAVQSLVFFSLFFFLRNHKIINYSSFSAKFNITQAKNLSSYTLMGLTSAVAVPMTHSFIREYLGANIGWDYTGYWQGMWSLSSMYLGVISTVIGVYYIPRLAELKTVKSIVKEILFGYKVLVPLMVIGFSIAYAIRNYLILVFYSESFMPMRDLFMWQLIGDFFKVCSWLLAYVMISKSLTKSFILSEIIFSLLLCILVVFFVKEFGMVGACIAYAVNYFLYLVSVCIMLVINRRNLISN